MFRRKIRIPPASARPDARAYQVEVPAGAVRIGMQVASLDRPWDEVPPLSRPFVVQDSEQLDTLRKYCLEVTVELNAEQYRQYQRHGLPPATSTTRTLAETKSVAAELPNARLRYQEALSLTDTLLTEAASNRPLPLTEAEQVVQGCLSSIINNPNAMSWLTRIRHKDAYMAEHSLRVCLLAITFGHFMDMPRQDLHLLGLCGLLHDIGKTQLPGNLLTRPGPLTRDEWQIMRSSPEKGHYLLQTHHQPDPAILDAALSHQEHMDGSGYPSGLAGSAINRFTRMISIADAYDAITSDRAYRKALSNGDALRLLYEQSGRHYDGELVETFIRMVGLYPPGSLVQLNSGEVAVILATRPDRKLHPTVELVLDTRGHPAPSRVLQLADRPLNSAGEPYAIARALPDGAAGFDFEEHIRRYSDSHAPGPASAGVRPLPWFRKTALA